MGVSAGLYMYVVVVQKFTFAISSPDEFLSILSYYIRALTGLIIEVHVNERNHETIMIGRRPI